MFLKLHLFYDTTAFIVFVLYFIADAFTTCVTQIKKLTVMLVTKTESWRHPTTARCPDSLRQLCPSDSTCGRGLKKNTCILHSSLRRTRALSLARCSCLIFMEIFLQWDGKAAVTGHMNIARQTSKQNRTFLF